MDLVALDDLMKGGVLAVREALMTANVPLPGPPNPRLMVPVEVPLPDPFKWGAAPV